MFVQVSSTSIVSQFVLASILTNKLSSSLGSPTLLQTIPYSSSYYPED